MLGSTPSVYHIVGIDDFTGDDQADILFRNTTPATSRSGRSPTTSWLSAAGGRLDLAAYHVVGTGDFDGNGANDILFRSDNGELVDVAAQQRRASC